LCELLGLDPLLLASEGRFVAFVPAEQEVRALAALHGEPLGREARVVGRVQAGPGRVVVRTPLGTRRLLHLPDGEALPRIC
jgi:hydrogenase expression/formation protein HypE